MKRLLTLLFLAYSVFVSAQTSPVEYNGRLIVKGTHLCNQDSVPIQLRGISSAGIQWRWNCCKKQSLTVLANEWGCDIFRVAMYISEGNAYNYDSTLFIARVDSMVAICTELGMYCIIDWHQTNPGDPNNAVYKGANAFFKYMAMKHGNKPNVLFEICNEPNGGVTWPSVKKYAEPIIKTIRTYSQNIIIVGTPNWCQEIDKPASSPIDGTNILYTFHFYADSHANLKSTFQKYVGSVPLFVTEFGTGASSGMGVVNIPESNEWMKILADNKVSWCNWAYSEKAETVSALLPNSCVEYKWNNTTVSGQYMKSNLVLPDNWVPIGGRPYFTSASTDMLGTNISVQISRELKDISANSIKDFVITVNNSVAKLTSISQGADKSIVVLSVDRALTPFDILKVSYSGTAIVDQKDSMMMKFELKPIENRIKISAVSSFINDFNDTKNTGWQNNATKDFTFNESNQALNISANYATATTDLTRPFVYALPVIVNMSSTNTISVKVKTTNKLALRVDVQDANGNISNALPVIDTITTNGSYAVYTFNYSGKYSKVDSTKIAKLLFYTNPGSTYSGTFTIDSLVIGATPVRVTALSISQPLIVIRIGETAKFGCTIEPVSATNKVLLWTVEDPKIAKIDSTGEVIPLKAGISKIQVQSLDNPSITTTCTIRVSGVIIDKTLLAASLVQAQQLLDSSVSGTAIGQYPPTNYDALKSRITTLNVIVKDTTADQALIDVATLGMQTLITTFRAAKIDNVLDLSIYNATLILNNSSNFKTQAEFDALKLLITNAKVVSNNPNITNSELEKAAKDLDENVKKLITETPIENLQTYDVIITPLPIFSSAIDIKSRESIIESVKLFSLDGKLLFVLQNRMTNCVINTDTVAVGTYVLTISLQSGVSKTVMVTKLK